MQKTAPTFIQHRWPIFLGLIVTAAVVLSRFLYAPSDDAYIFLVYAKNLLSGNGLTFNGTLVEGFSSPLWMALLPPLNLEPETFLPSLPERWSK